MQRHFGEAIQSCRQPARSGSATGIALQVTLLPSAREYAAWGTAVMHQNPAAGQTDLTAVRMPSHQKVHAGRRGQPMRLW
jgi:hypothetical protein